MKKGDRLAIVGENGKGKSTLLKTLIGMIEPLGGSFTFGPNVEWGYFDQHKAVVNDADPEQTVLDNFWEEYPKLLREEIRSALGSFLFSQEEVMKKMGQLSGGEKVRLALCKMFQTRPNLLILDEPTNHMDLPGKEALEQMLLSFPGTVLFVSHDRYFVKQVATGILEFDKTDVKRPDNKPDRQEPTLQDVFDKKTYYNPGKIKSRLVKQLEKYEKQLADSEENTASLKMQLLDPALASDYQKLMELQKQIEEEEHKQETLLERMLETETDLEEM